MDKTTATFEAERSTLLDGPHTIRPGRLTTFGAGIILGVGLALAAVTVTPRIGETVGPPRVAVDEATTGLRGGVGSPADAEDTRSLTERYSQSHDGRIAGSPAEAEDTRSLTERYSQPHDWRTSGTLPD